MAATEAGAWSESLDLSFYADSSMTLPGKSGRGEGCGEWYPREFCDECGEPRLGKSVCQQRGCPECWRSWTRNRAEGVTKRLGAARYVAEDGLQSRAVHAVMSPPEGEIQTLTDVSEGYRDAYRLAEEKGVRGGVAIFHGFRVREEYRKRWREETNDGEDGPKLWAWVREHPTGWRSITYWSPHYHILGLSADFEADDPEDQEGWVARRIRSLESFRLTDPEGYEDMVGASMYLLSHGTFESDSSKDCVRWFGELATTKFSPEEELSEGSWNTVQRYAAEAAAVVPEEEGEGSGSDEGEECENCGGSVFSPIWEAGGALMDEGWLSRIGREQERKLTAAFEWAIGERKPPPGMQRPQTEEQAREAFEALL